MPKRKKKKRKNKASRSDWEARRLDLDARRPLATAVPVARIWEGDDAARLETQTSPAQSVEAAALLLGSGVQASDAAAAATGKAAVSAGLCRAQRTHLLHVHRRARTVKMTDFVICHQLSAALAPPISF